MGPSVCWSLGRRGMSLAGVGFRAQCGPVCLVASHRKEGGRRWRWLSRATLSRPDVSRTCSRPLDPFRSACARRLRVTNQLVVRYSSTEDQHSRPGYRIGPLPEPSYRQAELRRRSVAFPLCRLLPLRARGSDSCPATPGPAHPRPSRSRPARRTLKAEGDAHPHCPSVCSI